MKNIYTLLLAVLLSSISVAQSSVAIRADIEKDKKAFIIEELELTELESEGFWTIYETYEKEWKALKTKQRQIKRALKNSEVLSAEEQYKLTEKYLILEKREAETKLKYLTLFSGKIGKKKAAAVFKAEDDFKRLLFKKIKKLPEPPRPPGIE
ncbi:MAG: hypothetical protein AB8B74_09940 [Crocinitomicaceae bacterium]